MTEMPRITIESAAEMLKDAGYRVRRNDGKVLNANTDGHHFTLHVGEDQTIDSGTIQYIIDNHARIKDER